MMNVSLSAIIKLFVRLSSKSAVGHHLLENTKKGKHNNKSFDNIYLWKP